MSVEVGVAATADTSAPPPASPNRVRQALRVVPVLVFVGTLLMLVRYALQPLINPDTYFHLRFGQEFLTGSWALRDPGTVTPFATEDWLPTQWSTQILMAAMEDWFGLGGVAWLSALQMLAFATALYLSARRYAPALAAAAVTVLAVGSLQMMLSARPQVWSFVFVSVMTVAWLETLRDGRPRWWLPVLTWLWATMHGMWPLAIVLAVVGATAFVLSAEWSARAKARVALVPVLCALAGAVTPIGPALYGAVLGVGERSRYFYEWSAPAFTDRSPMLVALIVGLTVLLMLVGRRPPLGDVLFAALAAAFMLYSIRTLPVAVAVAVPLLARAAAPYLEQAPVPRWERRTVAGALVGSLAVAALLMPSSEELLGDRPVEVETALAAMPPGTPLLNDWGQGGYLMWRAPQVDLVMHGYGDTFTDDELERNTMIRDLEPGWDRGIRELGVRDALLPSDGSLAYALEEVYDWEVVVADDDLELVLLRAPDDWPAAVPE